MRELNLTESQARVRVTVSMVDDGWKQVWAEMTDAELEERLFTYLWLSLNTINPHADRVAQLIQEAERRGKPEMVERARMKAEATPVAKAE